MRAFLAGFSDRFAMALALWPLASAVLTLPLLAFLYHRDGRLRLRGALGAYASVLYVLALGCFTLYPLPSGTSGLGITYGVSPQLNPLAFVGDVRKDGLVAVLQLVANVALFVPLGVICGKGLRLRLGWSVLVGFGVSLVVETAQLTGLFGLYPYAYRTFDVDDLATNTLGAAAGWWLARAAGRVLPTVARPGDADVVTTPGLVRRTVAFCLDMALVGVVTTLVEAALALVALVAVLACCGLASAGGQDPSQVADAWGEALWPALATLAVALPACALVVFEGVVPWRRQGRTLGADFVRMTVESCPRGTARRALFYAARLLTIACALAFAPLAVPVLALFWLVAGRMPHDFV